MGLEARERADLNLRQKEVWKIAKTEGLVQVDRLAERLNVSAQTIRRDLNQLTRARLLQRIHGGAITCDSVVNLGYGARKLLAAEGKVRIAKKAAELIPNDCSLFINIGTTTEQVAVELARQHDGLLVVTNNLNVLNTVVQNDQIEAFIVGGQIRPQDGGIVDNAATDFVSQFRVDYAVIGASSIEEQGIVTDFDWREVCVARTMIQHARGVILVADSNKLKRKAPVFLCELKEIDHFITDAEIPKKLMQYAHSNEVSVHVCS
ncbi:MAG: DeoR/GlpR family DNA-binding transcription regulator [Gammaproteobacteria bacterium]|nr:DeoR/GlpR family DNA-binding transcription regulator [Gammaproteobacteria bacterium]MCY4229008.1 DeoR/GlpR family DNA-binding transcription regulator [Gammaproteobacteria bacterium]MCY4313728.1 DeoR/GlpR family DNA-binding transcription regulator [Gammaproteobacteria bacterium]